MIYTCAVQVAVDAASGSYAVRCANLGTSTREGDELPASCADGAIIVSGQPVETTPSVPPTPTVPPTVGPVGVPVFSVGTASGHPGERVIVDFRLRTAGPAVAGVQADIAFSPAAPIARRPDGHPDCTFGAAPNFAGYSGVTLQPVPCEYVDPDTCTFIRALLITAELVVIPDAALLMSCAVDIAADAAPGVYPLSLSNLGASDPNGVAVELDGHEGAIAVTEPAVSEPPEGTSEGEQPVSGSGVPRAVSGCAITEGPASPGSWWLLTAAVLLGLRRWRGECGRQ